MGKWKSSSAISRCSRARDRRFWRRREERSMAGQMLRAIEVLLGRHYVYRTLRKLTGSDRVNREFVEKYVRPRSGDLVLDLGCGPADVFAWMPQVTYIGVDASPDYIAAARRRYGENAT